MATLDDMYDYPYHIIFQKRREAAEAEPIHQIIRNLVVRPDTPDSTNGEDSKPNCVVPVTNKDRQVLGFAFRCSNARAWDVADALKERGITDPVRNWASWELEFRDGSLSPESALALKESARRLMLALGRPPARQGLRSEISG